MVALPPGAPTIYVRGTWSGVDGISTTGSAVDITMGYSGTWYDIRGTTTTGSAVDAETPAVTAGLGVGVAFPSSEEILENLLVKA